MSYADVVAHGPKQSAEEARAPPVPSLSPSESQQSVTTGASLIDVDSPHVSSVKSDFEDQAVKTETQATRLAHEAEDLARRERRRMAEAADSTTKKGATKGKKIKEELAKDKKKISDNRDNPVVVGNALIWSIGVAALAAGAYRKHQDGQLDWKLAGTVGGIVAVFGVADYFGSKWLTENKYPLK